MPHESTAEPEDVSYRENEGSIVQSRGRSRSLTADSFSYQTPPGRRALSLVAETPMTITHHHDDDDDDEKITT